MRQRIQLALVLIVVAAVLLAIGWPIAARHRAERLQGVSYTNCGLGEPGYRILPAPDGNPEHAAIASYTTFQCGKVHVTVWAKTE